MEKPNEVLEFCVVAFTHGRALRAGADDREAVERAVVHDFGFPPLPGAQEIHNMKAEGKKVMEQLLDDATKKGVKKQRRG